VVTAELNEPSPIASSTALTLYDDFSDPAYEGRFNPAKWLPVLGESCQVSQQAGVMAFTNIARSTGENCNLVVGLPEQVTASDLGVLEARLQVSSDRNDEYLNQGLSFWTEESPGGGWYVFCGLDTTGDTVQAFFETVDWATGQDVDNDQSAPAEVDRWYTVRLEANPATMTFDCYVDDTRLGSVALGETAVLSTASFERALGARPAR
jgi:hypothetical protein